MCTLCKKELESAKGHSYVDGRCTECNKADPDYHGAESGVVKYILYSFLGLMGAAMIAGGIILIIKKKSSDIPV